MSGTNSLIICTDNRNTDLFTSGTFYLPLLGFSSQRVNSSSPSPVQIPAEAAFTVSHLGCRANTNTYSGGSTAVINFQKNGSNGNQQIVGTGAGTGWLTDATHSDTLTVSDLYNIAFVANSGGPDFDATIFQAQVNNASPNVPYGAFNTTNAWTISTGLTYNPVFGYARANQTAENSASQSLAESGGVLSALSINVTAVSGSMTAHSRVAASNGNQVIVATTTGVATDSTHTDTVSAGSLIDTSTIGATSATISFVTYNFAGTSSQHDIGSTEDSSGISVSSGSVVYFFFGGNLFGITTESWTQHVLPYAITASKLRVSVSAQTQTSTLVSRKAGVTANQTVSVTGTGWFTDVTHTDSFTAGGVADAQYTQGIGGSNSINAVAMSIDDGSNTGVPPYVPPPTHKPPKPPKPPKVGKPGPKGKPKNYNVDSTGLAATAYRRELAAIQRRHVVPGGIIYNLTVGSALGSGVANAISANLAFAIASAVGSGDSSGVSLTGQVAVGTASGAGAATAIALGAALSVGSAIGSGLAIGVSPTLMYAAGQAAGAGAAFGVASIVAYAAGTAAGAARVRAIGVMQGRVLPFDIDRAWAIDINGSIIDAVQYDPITMVLRVIYVVPLVIDVGGMPYSITNTIGSSPDPQAYVLGLVASAVN